MKIENLKALVNGTGALTAGAGVTTSILKYLEYNSVVIGVIISLVTLIVYMFFQILYFYKLSLADQNKIDFERYKKDTDEKLKDLKETIKKLGKGE